MTEERQIKMFGEVGRAETVVRFIHNIPEDAKLAMIDDEKYKIITLRNYGFDSVIYLTQVKEW